MYVCVRQLELETYMYNTIKVALTIFIGEDRLHVVVEGVGYGDGGQDADDGSEREHQAHHDPRKVHSRYRVQHHCSRGDHVMS